MEKVLIPNGSFHDIPLIRELKRMGYYVVASGANPDQRGYRYADRYVYGDFSDPAVMLEIAKAEGVDQVCSNCNDFGYLSACYVAEQLGFPGHDPYETALTLHKKDRFKAWAAETGLLTPPAQTFRDAASADAALETMRYPVIVKPTDLGAGQGIRRADTPTEARTAVRDALEKSKAKSIVIEPFIEGTSHSFNAFVVRGRVVNWYSDNEYMRYDPYRVSTSASPAAHAEQTDPVLLEQTERVVKALDLTDGLVHSQYILDRDGVPHILEITRRMSGDWYPYPETRAQGADWVHWIVCSELGLDCGGMPSHREQREFTGRHCLNGPRPGVVTGVELSERLRPHVYDSALWLDGGYTIRDVKKDYPGILFFAFDNREEQLDIVEHMDDHVKLVYQES